VDFVIQEHTLMHAAREQRDYDLAAFLDCAAENVFEHWELHGRDDLAGIIADIEQVSTGRKQTGSIIDVENMTCSCKGWLTKRVQYARDNPSRLCSHLTRYFFDKIDSLPEALKPYAEFIKGRGERRIAMPMPQKHGRMEYGVVNNAPYILEMNRDAPWVSVRLPYGKKYAFSVKEKRWSNAGKPENTAWFEQKAIEFSQHKAHQAR
jgi:hypothetical protein